MKQITSLDNIIFPDDENEQKIDLNKAFVISVSDNKVSLLINDCFCAGKKLPGFVHFCFEPYCGVHSCSDTMQECIKKNFNSATKIYYFKDLQDFADAILENNWTI